jgi:hypothetical protein
MLNVTRLIPELLKKLDEGEIWGTVFVQKGLKSSRMSQFRDS